MPDWTTCRKAQHPEQTVEQYFSVFTYCGAAHQYDRLPVVVVGVITMLSTQLWDCVKLKVVFCFMFFQLEFLCFYLWYRNIK